MRTAWSIGVALAALAGILGLSMSSVLREQEELVDDFTQATRQQAHASVEVLSARLDALDQDTRMLSDLIELSKTGADLDPSVRRTVWETAFRALAVAVSQYRSIALVGPDGTFEVLAVDPSEPAATVAALIPDTRRLALEVSAKQAQALGKPARIGDRSFLLYGKPVSGGRAIVVASDAAIFLGAVAWTPLPTARLFVTDPAGVIWAGCETTAGCRATANTSLKDLQIDLPPARQMGARGATTIHSTRIPAVQVSERVDRPTGSWVVTWLAPTGPILARQTTMVTRLVLTALAAAVAVAVVGAMILRQQRKAGELEGRLRYTQALASARQTSQSIVENAPLGVLGVSRDGRVVLANSFLTDRLGAIRIGAPLKEAFPGVAAGPLRDLETLLQTELGIESDGPVGADLRSVTTVSHQFHVRIVPVTNHELGVSTFALVEDQSDLRSLEHQLVRAEKLITVGVLSAGIAHEIGSPLVVIRGRAEQVLRSLDGGQRSEDLRMIIKHIDNIASTIRQVLDFSRRQRIERRAVPFDAVLERARSLLQWKLDARHLELDLALEDDLPMLAADPDQMQQVLVNLLLNACDASGEGGRVEVAARGTRAGFVQIEVVDRGCGIAPEHLNAVFDPFFTTKKRGEGTGLGLSIVASIVRNHGGEIQVVSALEKGTKVTMSWPTASPTVPRRVSQEGKADA